MRANRREDGYTFSDTENGYQEIRPGDLVFHALDGFAGAVGVSDSHGNGSPVYHVCEAIEGNHPEFLARLLRHLGTSGFLTTQAPSVRERSVDFRNWNTFARVPLVVPPPDEQRAIADYLDHETAQIDTLIAKQEQLIATLRERRDGLIERALVCGLDPVVDQRAAAIPWLAGARVPSHWDATRVKHLVLAMRAGEGITADNIEEIGPYRVFGGNGLRGYATAYTHSGTFVLIGRQGALCGNVHLVHGEFWASEHAIVVTPREGVDVRWLAQMLRLMNLGQYSMTTAQPGIGVGQLAPLLVPLPPLDEQREIATYIDKQTAKIEALIAKAERFIELSKERRTALITAAVTGQIDVRAA